MRRIILYCVAFLIVSELSSQIKCLSGDCFNGYGSAVLKEDNEKRFYIGNFVNGNFEGWGELESNTKSGKITYKGNFKKGKFEGNGFYQIESASYMEKYNGQFSNGLFNGKGTYERRFKRAGDYEISEGIFTNGEIHGFSKLVSNKFTYLGELSNGVRDGLGLIVYNDGNSYAGYFENNKYYHSGVEYVQGKFRCAGQVSDSKACVGMVYSCSSDKDCFSGYVGNIIFGKQIYSKSNEVYFGYLDMGERSGLGVLWNGSNGLFKNWGESNPDYPNTYKFTKNDKDCVTGSCQDALNVFIMDSVIHIGEFKDFKPSGLGFQIFDDVAYFCGHYNPETANLKDGYNLLEFDSFINIGDMEDNNFTGKGVIIDALTKIVYVGSISGIVPHGKGIMMNLNNQIINFGEFENGNYIGE